MENSPLLDYILNDLMKTVNTEVILGVLIRCIVDGLSQDQVLETLKDLRERLEMHQ